MCEEIGVRCPAATDDRTVLIKHGALCLDREYLVGIYIKVMHIVQYFFLAMPARSKKITVDPPPRNR